MIVSFLMWLTTWFRSRTAVYEINYEYKAKVHFRGILDEAFLRSSARSDFVAKHPNVRWQNITLLRIED